MKYVDQESLTYEMPSEFIGVSSVNNCIAKYVRMDGLKLEGG